MGPRGSGGHLEAHGPKILSRMQKQRQAPGVLSLLLLYCKVKEGRTLGLLGDGPLVL